MQEALGELAGAAQEGLLALSVGVGLGLLSELMEEEVTEVFSPKGRHDPERTAVRHYYRLQGTPSRRSASRDRRA